MRNITSLTGNGLKDWLIQRVSAVYLAIYSLALGAFLMIHPQFNYAQWAGLFHRIDVQIATLFALLMILLHAWIGIWTVLTDYVKCTAWRLILQIAVAFGLVGQLIWAIMMIWGK